MKMYIELTQEEIQRKIPYAMVCEGMCGASWNTGRRKRLMKETFTEEEIAKLSKLKAQAYSWYLVKGVPMNGVKMTLGTLALWQKLGDFCASL